MGWWESKRGISGDTPADIIGKAFKDVNSAYEAEAGRKVTIGELADMIEFVACRAFEVTVTRPTDTTLPFTVD